MRVVGSRATPSLGDFPQDSVYLMQESSAGFVAAHAIGHCSNGDGLSDGAAFAPSVRKHFFRVTWLFHLLLLNN